MKFIVQVAVFVMFSCMLMTQSLAGTPADKSVGNEQKELSPTVKQLANHFEFLGYKVEIFDKKDKPYFIARHDIHNNVVVQEYIPNFIYLRTYLLSPKAYSPDMTELTNKLANNTDVASVFITENKETNGVTLNFYALYTGGYSREIFGTFLELYKKDLDKIRYMENYTKLFVK